MFVAIELWNGEIQVLYQLLDGSGRYSVYSTAMRMPRFFTVVHQVVLKGCWQRVPSSGCEHVPETSSSTPSVTRNRTSCGVEAEAPVPGSGMVPLICDMADSKLVSVSLLQFELVKQLLSYTSKTLMFDAAVPAVVRFDVSVCTVVVPE